MSADLRLTGKEHRSLLAEIESDARSRRASGDFGPEIDRLDEMFSAMAPPIVGDELRFVLDRAELATFVDVAVPVASNLPGGRFAKKALRKGMRWYFDYVAQQVNEFHVGASSAIELLARRMEKLEAAIPAVDPRLLIERSNPLPQGADDGWSEKIPALLEGVDGRVAVIEVVDEALLAALDAAGFDAYGVDPLSLKRDWSGKFEVRADSAIGHLTAVGPGTLGALVLTTCTDQLPTGDLVELADLAVTVVREGGRLVVVGTDPVAWAASCSPVEADLAAGHPLHPETWQHLLEDRRFSDLAVLPAVSSSVVEGRPASYAVVATAPGLQT